LPEDISPIQILRNKRSGGGRPRSSAEMLTCYPYKRKYKESLKKRKLFQPGKQETKRLRRNCKGVPDQHESKPMRMKKMVNQAYDVICIYCKGRFSDYGQGERWRHCVMCWDLCHADCAGADKDIFICDYCLQNRI